MYICVCVLVIIIVSISFSHLRAIHSNTKLLVRYLILHIGIHSIQYPTPLSPLPLNTSISSSLFTMCSLLLVLVMLFADVVDRATIVQDMMRLIFSLLCLCFCIIWCTRFQTDRSIVFQFHADTKTILMCVCILRIVTAEHSFLIYDFVP